MWKFFYFPFKYKTASTCPFCLFFALVVILAFIVNFEVSSAWSENRRKMWLFFLGEVKSLGRKTINFLNI
ncbi:hypothetical protein DS62_10920 [Smithella sp. SC_K08D17]|nr:hypothetical protein KD27_00060 [Smithella sp. D17]KIE18634.1 hypothetical protein DS62_10920 [Smithella sp. SC_K08D17]